MNLSLASIAHIVGGRFTGVDRSCDGVAIDSRSVCAGALFVAIPGERFDGHQFIQEAAARGAQGVMVQRAGDYPLAAIEVPDTRQALAALAQAWRQRFEIPVIGVTGSNGKTTVKGMLASILGCAGPGTATTGNLNNDLGVPLTLLRIKDGDRFAVIEMGMNHPGEIAVLTRWSAPTVAVITNAAAAHLEGLGSVAAVARAKGEIFSGLPQTGVAVINASDPYHGLWRELAGGRRVLTFGCSGADVTGEWQSRTHAGVLHIRFSDALGGGEVEVPLQLLGRHNAANALAATASALAVGCSLEHVVQGLAAMRPVAGRLEPVLGRQGSLILNDTYNANPGSVGAAIEVLQTFAAPRILVLGDMLELGAESQARHEEAGRSARSAGIDSLFALGPQAAAAAQAFGPHARHFTDVEALCAALQSEVHAGVTVLVKGSRGMRMERVVQAFSQHSSGEVH